MIHLDSGRNRLIGIGITSIAVLCFALLDGTAKYLIRSLPIFEVVWLRFLTQVLISLAVVGPLYGRRLLRTQKPRLQVLRGLMLGTMTGLNFVALWYLQLAETAAIMFLAPILVAGLGWWLLNEAMDRGRLLAIVIGFIGVLIILQPGARGFHPAMLLSLINAILVAFFGLLSRHMARTENPASTQVYSGLIAVLMFTPFAFTQWQWPESAQQWLLLVALGSFAGLGHYCLAASFQYAGASTLAPFQYQQILYMMAYGYLVFGDVPSAAVVLGSLVVIGSGLYLLLRERQVSPASARP